MKLGFGLISCQRYPGDQRSSAGLYSDALELAEYAERLGYDSVWLNEHHFVEDESLPSLLPLCAAIAARTKRIEIGTCVLLAPLVNPLRLAEDAAVVDLISGGRLLLGIGQGWRHEEFEALGVPREQRGIRFYSTAEVLAAAWSEGRAPDASGAGVFVTPKPARPGGPPVLYGVSIEKAVRRAAREAGGILMARETPATFAQRVGWILEELEAVGRRPADFIFGIVLPLFASSATNPWDEIQAHHSYVEWQFDHIASSAPGPSGVPATLPAMTREREILLRTNILVGSPDEVVAGLLAYRDVVDVDIHVVSRLYWPGLPMARQIDAMEVVAREVLPAIRS